MKKRKDSTHYGTAKIINRTAARSADVEQAAKLTSLRKGKDPAFDSPVRIRIVSYRSRLADPDGVSAKYAIDGLVFAGIIADDSAKYVRSVSYEQVKVKNKSQEKTILEIEVVE